MDETDRVLLTEIQKGIPLTSQPFLEIAKRLNIGEEEVIERLKQLRRRKVIRRFGASISARKIGIVANALVAWKVPESRLDEVGRIMAGYDNVTHCYARQIVLGRWEYNLFIMVHKYSREEVKSFAKILSQVTNIDNYLILFSAEEFKAAGSRYIM